MRFNNSKKFKFLIKNNENKKIEFEFIIFYIHEQNSIAEKINQILLAIMKAFIFESKILKIF